MRRTGIAIFIFLIIPLLVCTMSFAEESLRQNSKPPDSANFVLPAVSSSTMKADSAAQRVAIGKFEKTNEEGDFWFFYIIDKSGKEIKFIYNSEDILKSKKAFEGKIIRVKYIEKEFEEAGSGDKFTEKNLESVEIQK